MPRIVETIVTTKNAKGEVHIAPLGLIDEGANWVLGAVPSLAHARQPARGAVRGREPYRRRARLCRERDRAQGLGDAPG